MSQKYTVARYVISGEKFEIMVNPEAALDYRLGRQLPISQVLVYEGIFKDVNKGEKASLEKLKNLFGTTDAVKIAQQILTKGELQLTTDQRKKLVEEKRKQIVTFISRQCMDPRTNLPHPPTRIEQAMSQIRISIDPFKDAEEQAKEVIQELRPILPIKMELLSIEVKIPPQFAQKAYGSLKSFGTIKKEQWQTDGSLSAVVEMPAGLHGPFLEKIGNVTRGAVQSKILR